MLHVTRGCTNNLVKILMCLDSYETLGSVRVEVCGGCPKFL